MIPHRTALVLALTSLSGCTKLHLQYDYGRAYVSTLSLQADLTRTSVLDDAYNLSGTEAMAIRMNAQQATTNAESGEETVGE